MKVKRLVVDLKRNTMQTTRKIVRLTELHVLARIYGMSSIEVLGYWDAPAEEIDPQEEYSRLLRVYGENAEKTYGEFLDGRIQEILKTGYEVFGKLKVYKSDETVPEVETEEEESTWASEVVFDHVPLKTKHNIKAALDRLGVEYTDHDTKDVLLDILIEEVPLQFKALAKTPVTSDLGTQITELYKLRDI